MRALRPLTLLIGLGAALVAGACSQPSSPPPAADAAIPDSADQVMFGGRTALTEGGIRQGELRFDTAYVYDQGRRFELKGVNAVFFEETTGAQQGTLVSREGTYNQATGIMEARGNVVVTRSDGAVLTTSQLRYNAGTNQITSDSAFTMKDPGRGNVEGIGFVTDPAFRELRVLRTLRATGTGPVSLPQ